MLSHLADSFRLRNWALKKSEPKRPAKSESGCVVMLVLALLSIAVVARMVSSPWIAPIFIPSKPSVSKMPARHPLEPTAKEITDAEKAALFSAVNDFDHAERSRAQKVAGTRLRATQIRAVAERDLVREADKVALRVVNWKVALRLMGGRARDELPGWVGGDPRAGENILREAIGNGSTNIQVQAGAQAFKEALVLTGTQSAGTFRPELESLESRLPRRVISTATLAVRPIARKLGLRAAERAAAKAPVTVLDGPLPAVDIALFGWTIWDVYKLSGSAIKETRSAVALAARQQNKVELDRTFGSVEASIARFDTTQKLANCSRLRRAYDDRPIPELQGLISSRC